MMIAASADDYLARVSDEHRGALDAVREIVRSKLPPGFEEGVLHGMLSWFVPPERYGHTYNGQPLMVAALASQKNYLALYLNGLYGNPEAEAWFADAFARAGKKLDMGKSCVRFRSLNDLPLDVIGQVAARFTVDEIIATYERAQSGRKQKPVVMPGRSGVGVGAVLKNKERNVSKEKTSAKMNKDNAMATTNEDTATNGETSTAPTKSPKAKRPAAKAKAAVTKTAAKAKPVATKAKSKAKTVVRKAKAAAGKAVSKVKAVAGKAVSKAKAAVKAKPAKKAAAKKTTAKKAAPKGKAKGKPARR
jgi:hypothetical protein